MPLKYRVKSLARKYYHALDKLTSENTTFKYKDIEFQGRLSGVRFEQWGLKWWVKVSRPDDDTDFSIDLSADNDEANNGLLCEYSSLEKILYEIDSFAKPCEMRFKTSQVPKQGVEEREALAKANAKFQDRIKVDTGFEHDEFSLSHSDLNSNFNKVTRRADLYEGNRYKWRMVTKLSSKESEYDRVRYIEGTLRDAYGETLDLPSNDKLRMIVSEELLSLFTQSEQFGRFKSTQWDPNGSIDSFCYINLIFHIKKNPNGGHWGQVTAIEFVDVEKAVIEGRTVGYKDAITKYP